MSNNRALQAFVGIGGSNLKSAKYSSIVPLSTLAGFEHTRNAGEMGNSFSGTFIDHSAYELENALIGLGSTIESRTMMFQYGWNTKELSRVHYGYIYDYSPVIVGNVVQLEILSVGRADVAGSGYGIDSYTSGSYNTNDPKVTYPQGVGLKSVLHITSSSVSPAELVAKICTKLGWTIGEITPTKMVSSRNITGITDSQITNPVDYIRKTLIPLSESASGVGNYRFWTDSGVDGKVVAYFKPTQTTATSAASFETNISISDKATGSFKYNHRDSKVINWNPVVSGAGLMSYGASGTGASTFEEETNEDYYVLATQATSQLPRDEARQWMPTNGAHASLKFSAASTDKVNRAVSNHWQNVMNYQYVVHCDIVGDPSRKVMETLDFSIYSGGRLHHTSGRYLVTGITDNFSPSGFITKLELLKNSSYAGPSSTVGGARTGASGPGSSGPGGRFGSGIMVNDNIVQIK